MVAVIACGALALDVRAIARRRGWEVDLYPVPAPLHNRPQQIPDAVAAEFARLDGEYDRVVVAYGDCGTYGALDTLLSEFGVERLQGENCYDVLARDEVREALAEQPGTYVLTDFLARTFEHTVVHELGLDRHPELLRRLLPPLHARALAGPARNAGEPRGRGARGRAHRATARGAVRRERGLERALERLL